ncbi:hypothetical protein [Hymenobacter sp. B81]|uniref:hypothetical protein n=1 Tax=Hymenobacter sp. B81 TaxID=3344878 RepID=UPI0037DD7BC1
MVDATAAALSHTFYATATVLRLRFLFLLLILGSCAYDNAEDIAGPAPECTPPAEVSYVQHITPLLNRNCYACHNSALQSGNVNLQDFGQLQQQARSGVLLGNVKHLPGYKPMPQGGAKLSDCDIALLQRWVEAGTPNN